jgi:hypothetical protein
MKSFNKLAGVIALLCTLTLSTFAQTKTANKSENVQFSKCVSTFRFKNISFDKSLNEMTITVSQSNMPESIAAWGKVKMYWFADVDKDVPETKINNAFMYWQTTEKDEYAVICATMPTSNISIVNGDYIFVCKVSAEQVKFFENLNATPWQNKSFTFSTLSAAN